MPLSLVEKGVDLFSRFNRFGCHIGRQQIVYYLNDKPYCAMPNLVGAGPWYMLMDVAVGGPRVSAIGAFPPECTSPAPRSSSSEILRDAARLVQVMNPLI